MAALNSEGYTVIPEILTRTELAEVRKEIVDAVFRVTFGEDHKFDLHDIDNLLLFTDSARRKRVLENPRAVWRNGDSRTPILCKKDGMINLHFVPAVVEHVQLNPKVYEAVAELYGTRRLVHATGPERVSLKIKGSPDMEQHIDRNLWDACANYPRRIQALVVVDVPEDVAPRDSGTLSLLVNFHHYLELAAALFHPKTGQHPFPPRASRFHVLPKRFSKQYLPVLNDVVQRFTAHYYGVPETVEPFKDFFATFVAEHPKYVPPREVRPVVWKPIQARPGDLIAWTQDLPHHNLRNKSATPRIVAYFSVFPIDDGFSDELRAWVVEQYATGKKYHRRYGTRGYPKHVKNPEEYAWLCADPKRRARLQRLYATDFARKLTGQLEW